MKQKHLFLMLLGMLLAVPFKALADDAVVATCAEVIAGEDGTVYRVTGTCATIKNTKYGNWYLEDATGSIYIYGTNDKEGNKGANPLESWDIAEGDIVTVEGPKTTYNGTVELVDVTVISVQKSKLTLQSITPADGSIPAEGGEVEVKLLNKTSNGVMIIIPEAAEDWLIPKSYLTADAAPQTNPEDITLGVMANEGAAREATVTFIAKDDEGTEYTVSITVKQAGGIVDATIAEFNAAEVGSTYYRLTGVITEVKNASYGNFYMRDYSGETYVYGTGSRGDFEAAGLKVGDIVTMVGTRDVYKDEIEMKNGTCESFIPVTEVSIADFLTKEDSKEVYYMVTGTITEIANANYGNLYLTDGENSLYVYGCYPGWGAKGDDRKGFLATAGIEVGDQLTVIGYKDTYKETIELANGIYFSHTSGTGISTMTTSEPQQEVIFNLAGQRLQAPQKGINIVGGKKMVVK